MTELRKILGEVVRAGFDRIADKIGNREYVPILERAAEELKAYDLRISGVVKIGDDVVYVTNPLDDLTDHKTAKQAVIRGFIVGKIHGAFGQWQWEIETPDGERVGAYPPNVIPVQAIRPGFEMKYEESKRKLKVDVEYKPKPNIQHPLGWFDEILTRWPGTAIKFEYCPLFEAWKCTTQSPLLAREFITGDLAPDSALLKMINKIEEAEAEIKAKQAVRRHHA